MTRGLRRAAGWPHRPVSRRHVGIGRSARPKISIVVPVYNVESYIAECLQSLTRQTLEDLEIVVVDDGSPDNSMAIVRSYAATDRRIRILTLAEHQGVSAARNAGVAAAHGTYLGFADPDDVVMPNAYLVSTGLLDESGSDFAVFGYERFDLTHTWRSASWITAIHKSARSGITAASYPDVLANAVVWSKVFRRSFWDEARLEFPVGMHYEDQIVSAHAYALATSIDVMGEVLYRWRDRRDKSSISQDRASVENLAQFVDAIQTALRILETTGAPNLAACRLAQYLVFDFTYYVPLAAIASDEYWHLLVRAMRGLFAQEQFAASMWDTIGPTTRVAYELVLRDDHERLVRFFGDGGGNIKNFPTEIVDGRAVVRLPFHADPQAGIAPSRFELLPRQLGLITSTRRAWWQDDEVFVIEGWAYIDNLDNERYPISTSAVLVREADGVEIPCEVLPRRDHDASSVTRHKWANYESSGFRVEILAKQLAADGIKGNWHLQLHAVAGGIAASGRLRSYRSTGSAGHLTARLLEDGSKVSPRFSRAGEFVLAVRYPALSLIRAGYDAGTVRFDFSAASPGWTTLQLSRGDERFEFPVTVGDDGVLSARCRLPERRHPGDVVDGAPSRDAKYHLWAVRVSQGAGPAAPIAWAPSAIAGEWDGSAPLCVFRTAAGNVGIDDATVRVRIMAAEASDERLILQFDVAGGDAVAAHIKLTGRAVAVGTSTTLTRGDNRIELPLVASPWGGPPLPLPVGYYAMSVVAAGQRVKVEFDPVLLEQTPVSIDLARLRAHVEVSRSGHLGLRVMRPLAPGERGARQQRELEQWHANLLPEPAYGVALFRSYYGENTACNAGAVHAELRRRGADITVYWSVSDYSVPVPEGGIPVVHLSTEWYRLLRNAEFIMDNMHQPIYHAKAPHQVVVATFHGYPFKAMGLPNWKRLGFSKARVDSFLRRAREWDFLVSPASYATPLLCRDFGFAGKALEIGYPRNDILVAPEGEELRREVRERLGIGANQTAILYAPTFRDYLSRNDFSAPAINLIDLPELADALGPDFVLLVRGHAFNARAGSRFRGEGVIDVTAYPDVAHLYLAADAAIVDYSSLRFDFAITKKPMLFLVPDKQRYIESRGWLLDFEATAPGPFVNDLPETLAALRNLEQVKLDYADAYQKFLDTYVDLDDGHASERLVDAVFALNRP